MIINIQTIICIGVIFICECSISKSKYSDSPTKFICHISIRTITIRIIAYIFAIYYYCAAFLVAINVYSKKAKRTCICIVPYSIIITAKDNCNNIVFRYTSRSSSSSMFFDSIFSYTFSATCHICPSSCAAVKI